MPLNITLPDDLGDGSTVTLSTNSSNVAIYASNDANTTETPLTLSGGSYVWTVTGPDSVPTQLFVGATGGSTTVGDTTFEISDSPAAQPGDPSPEGQDPATKRGTTDPIEITLNDNPNNDPLINDPKTGNKLPVNEDTINWLVGQSVSLTAVYTGPVPIHGGLHYQIDIKGGEYLKSYKYTANSGTTVAYSTSSATPTNNTPTGGPGVQTTFFWVSTDASAGSGPAASEIETVTASLKGSPLQQGSVKFDLFEPTAVTGGAAGQAGISVPGSPLAPPGLATGLFVNPQSPPEPPGKTWPIPPSSIYYSAQVTTPLPAAGAQFNQGHFSFLQLVELQRAYYYDSPALDSFSQYPNQFILDVQYPFNKGSPYDPLDNQLAPRQNSWVNCTANPPH